MSAKVLSNLESVGDLVGALKGISDGLEEDTYIEGLVKEAHGKAATAFNVAAAATASAGHIRHVYEFGVPGITEGQAKFADPTSPAARLWVHTLTGHGGQQDIGYTFRPALNRNPEPTTASTGVPSKYLAKLSRRKYVFWNKAFVMETGQNVEIKSRQSHGLLFVPTPGNNAPRNFVMWNTNRLGPIRTNPGQTTQGTFTAFWMSWWAASGSEIIDQSMRSSVTWDINKAVEDAARKAQAAAVKPAQMTNIPSAVSKARVWAKKMFGGTREMENETV